MSKRHVPKDQGAVRMLASQMKACAVLQVPGPALSPHRGIFLHSDAGSFIALFSATMSSLLNTLISAPAKCLTGSLCAVACNIIAIA